jgi:tRNA threonylcarbamoyladenosine biosynthesis protein TsaB
MSRDVKLLAVETSGRIGRIALAAAGRTVVERDIASGMRHGQELLPVIDAAVRSLGWSPEEIALVALSGGPGSFTGLRLAVMFARTFCWRTGARSILVPTLRAVAGNAPADRSAVAVIADAQRGGVYWATYARAADGSLQCTSPEAVSPPEEVAAKLPADIYLIGTGLEPYGAAFGDRPRADAALGHPRAAVIAELAWAMHQRGEHTPPDQLEPLYVRRPAPEEVWERRQRGGR